jgi:hypothetical protein
MNDLADFFTRKSSKYWMKSLIYDDRIVNFYDEGRFLFIESLKKDYIFDGYWEFNIKVDDIDFMIQILLNLVESKIIKYCKFDMLGLNGFISCFIYLDSDDTNMMKLFLKEFLSLNIFERNRFGMCKDIEFNFLKQNPTRKIMLSNYVDLINGKLK